MTRDLRRRALESNKTVSRKAASRVASEQASGLNSKNGSRAGSRVASRAQSRAGSDDDDYVSDDTQWSTNSIDELLTAENADAPTAWRSILEDRMEELINRKKSTVEGRERCLAIYTHMLCYHYAQEEVESKLGELYPSMLKSIRLEDSEREALLALRALGVTLITSPSETVYDMVYQPLKSAITNSESVPIKQAAIHTLGVATVFGGASLDETQSNMDYLLEIVESDGQSVDAPDAGAVVAAALEEWGFLATSLDDTEDATEPAMEAFVEQLESSDASVAIASGENIALLYESSYTEQEEDEEISEAEDSEDDDHSKPGPKYVKRYTVWRREDQLKHSLSALASVSGRGISKKDKKSLHTNFADILNSVEYPTRGPRYSNAISQDTGKRYGSRMTVKMGQAGSMRIDKWWKLHRLQALRRLLQGGFVTHYEDNAVIFDCLPIMMSKN